MSIRTLLVAVPFPVVQLDHDLKVLFANAPFAAAVGALAPQLVGRPAEELTLDPIRYGRWHEHARSALQLGRPAEHVVPNPTGGETRCQFIPQTGPDGKAESVVVTLPPAPLPSEVEQFGRLMDRAPFHAWLRTAGGEYVYANPSYLAEVPAPGGGVIGKHPADCWPADLAEHYLANDRKVIESGRAVESVEPATRTDGAARQWVVVKFPYGGGEYVAGIGVDVTDRLEVEQDRRALERRLLREQWADSLGLLAGGMAHDFNNLLTTILGNASLARMNVSDPSPVADCLRKVETAAMRAGDLCRQVLAYSGRGQLVVKEVDLNALVRDAAAGFGGVVSKRVSTRLSLTDPLPAVRADPSQVRQLLLNLVANASDAIGERGGVITVTTGVSAPAGPHPPGGYVSLAVADTGAGMDEATVARIFEPFFTTKFTGRGLGLSAVQGIVRGHDGHIRVASEAGKGTTVTVLLPVTPPPPPAPKRSGNGRIVLVADDEDDVRLVARRLLQAAGFHVLLAHDGADAVATFREFSERVAAVLLDRNMPRMTAAEAVGELRRIRGEVKVILTGGYGYPDGPVGLAAGEGVAFLRKPFTGEELLSAVFAAVGG